MHRECDSHPAFFGVVYAAPTRVSGQRALSDKEEDIK